jgi:hypothetical protein
MKWANLLFLVFYWATPSQIEKLKDIFWELSIKKIPLSSVAHSNQYQESLKVILYFPEVLLENLMEWNLESVAECVRKRGDSRNSKSIGQMGILRKGCY